MWDETLEQLATSIKELRTSRNISAQELAANSKIACEDLIAVEAAERPIRMHELLSVSSALDVPLIRFFGGEVHADA